MNGYLNDERDPNGTGCAVFLLVLVGLVVLLCNLFQHINP